VRFPRATRLLQAYDLWFRPIFAFFIIDHGSRKVVHIAVTREPSAMWVAQPMRNATPFGVGPHFIIRDRDDKFGRDFDRAAQGAGATILKTPVRTPRANAICERFLGSVRRECLDHVLVLASGTCLRSSSNTAVTSTNLVPIKVSVSACQSARSPRPTETARSSQPRV
jgi:transposase InsO family protein